MSLNPERLGHPTTIHFSIRISASVGTQPPALTQVQVFFPVGFAFGLSELGLAGCSSRTLEAIGPKGCPRNAIMGFGNATAEAPFGPSVQQEEARVTVVRAAADEQPATLLFYAEAWTPTIVEMFLPALLLPASFPYGGNLKVEVPLLTVLPDSSYISVVQFAAAVGPEHLLYLTRAHGQPIEYRPRGIPIPERCPHGGFRFAATLSFQDGSRGTSQSVVPCPRRAAERARPVPQHNGQQLGALGVAVEPRPLCAVQRHAGVRTTIRHGLCSDRKLRKT